MIKKNWIIGYVWTQIQTTLHKFWVFYYMQKIIWKLMYRSIVHDLSKYRLSEATHFARHIFQLKAISYGTPEYVEMLESLRPATSLHYARNSHHPEHHQVPCSCLHEQLLDTGVGEPVYITLPFQDCGLCKGAGSVPSLQQMNFLDRVEMICDWKAAGRRHKTGSLSRSLEQNKIRFKIIDDDMVWLHLIADEIDST